MTPKQRQFADEYVVDCNGKQAAIRAGFGAKHAKQTAYDMLQDPKVIERISEGLADKQEKTQIKAEYVLRGLKTVAERCMQGESVMEFDRESKEMTQATDYETGRPIWKFDSAGAKRALELLGKTLKLFTDRVEHDLSAGFAERMKRAEERVKRG